MRCVVGLLTAGTALAGSAAMADCRYGDAVQPERAEIVLPDGERALCVEGRWLPEKDIRAMIIVEKANLWTQCCGSADEAAFVRSVCDTRESCVVAPAANWAGAESDPARRKHLWVSYHCAVGSKDLPTSHAARQVEEDAPLALSCRRFTYR